MNGRMNTVAFLMVLVLTAFSFIACKKSDNSSPSFPKNVSVEYKVSGTGFSKVEILRYTNATGGTTSLSETSLPFSVSFNRTVNGGDDLVLSVLHNNPSSTAPLSAKLEIYVDGRLVKTETYDGAGRVSGATVYIF